jgi:hypothetical protein
MNADIVAVGVRRILNENENDQAIIRALNLFDARYPDSVISCDRELSGESLQNITLIVSVEDVEEAEVMCKWFNSHVLESAGLLSSE